MGKLQVEKIEDFYYIYLVYEEPKRKILLVSCNSETYKLLCNHFSKEMIYG